MKLNPISSARRYKPVIQNVFGGLNETPGAGGTELSTAINLTSDHYPVLSVRDPYGLHRSVSGMTAYGTADKEYWVAGTSFYYDGTAKGTITAGAKEFAVMGSKIIIYPDKKIYDWVLDTFTRMGADWTGASLTFSDGEIYEVEAAANTVYASNAAWGSNGFAEGDAVTISGCTTHPENNMSLIIREIDGDYLRFDENVFTLTDGAAYTETGTMKVEKEVPDMDFLCVQDNRLWGCKGDYIYASKLGDPTNFNVFDGLSTDSWQATVEDTGDFTGCYSYLGYPTFFKENMIYKVYGSSPSAYGWQASARGGVAEGAHRTLAEVEGTLYYLSPQGVCAYRGSAPTVISSALGDRKWRGLCGGGSKKYYICLEDGDAYAVTEAVTAGTALKFTIDSVTREFTAPAIEAGSTIVFDGKRLWVCKGGIRTEISYTQGGGGTAITMATRYAIYCYDAKTGIWMRESFSYDGNAEQCSDPAVSICVWNGSPMALLTDGKVISLDGRFGDRQTEKWECTFGDHVRLYADGNTGSENRKGLLKIRIRYDGAGCAAAIRYDHGDWTSIGTLSAQEKESQSIPLTLRRCDHYALKLSGNMGLTRPTRVYSITAFQYAGSDV